MANCLYTNLLIIFFCFMCMQLADYVLCKIYRNKTKPSKDFESLKKRAASEGHEISSNNGDVGDQEIVVASASPPIQQNGRMRTSSVHDGAINNVEASSTPSTSFIAQPGNQDGMVNNSNGIYGNNTTGNFLLAVVDSPYPLRTLWRPPSNFYSLNHQMQLPMQSPSNLFNSNPQQQYMPQAQQHRQVQHPYNSYRSNQQHYQMDMQLLAQHGRHRQLEFQNPPLNSNRNNGYSRNFEMVSTLVLRLIILLLINILRRQNLITVLLQLITTT
ncbi:hypothetical protein Scep_007083 [Stephania cephalantha]|uniref:Uncharacterized protein n=1 Tax=Stephania cephalantha TaxID=152367 RepID=A0AAP0K958_9MAGN